MKKRPRRIVILKAAGRLFFHYGPLKTTIADIAKEAQVGVGSVYLEFRSKDEILSALSEQLYGAVLQAERDAWAVPGTVPARLARVFERRLDAFLEKAQAGAHGPDLFGRSCGAVAEAHERFAEEERTLLASFLEEAGVHEPVRSEAAVALLDAHAAFSPPSLFKSAPDTLRGRLRAMHRVLLTNLRFAAPTD
ncbi:MAG: TetR/AcrR family transcriptional regulator [Sandaracinaceae bacterium]